MEDERGPSTPLTESQIDRAIAAATAGHRMAGMEPSAASIEIGRRQLRGEISGNEAVALAVATAIAEYDSTRPE